MRVAHAAFEGRGWREFMGWAKASRRWALLFGLCSVAAGGAGRRRRRSSAGPAAGRPACRVQGATPARLRASPAPQGWLVKGKPVVAVAYLPGESDDRECPAMRRGPLLPLLRCLAPRAPCWVCALWPAVASAPTLLTRACADPRPRRPLRSPPRLRPRRAAHRRDHRHPRRRLRRERRVHLQHGCAGAARPCCEPNAVVFAACWRRPGRAPAAAPPPEPSTRAVPLCRHPPLATRLHQ